MSTVVANTAADLNGATLLKASGDQTITGNKTFDRGTNAPFTVNAGSGTVTHLDADHLDGEDGADYHNASLLSAGTVPDGRFPATLPAASGENLTALNASNLTTGSLAIARAALLAQGFHIGGRLTLTTGVPVTRADVTAATSIKFTPFKGGMIPLFTAAAWELKTFTELSLAVPASTNQMYDIWLYNNAGTLTLEALAWTNDTTRATALATQDGWYAKNGALDRFYVGSFRTTGVSGQTEDSAAKRYLYNAHNRVLRSLQGSAVTGTYNYTTDTLRQFNSAAGVQLDVVVGLDEDMIEADAVNWAYNGGSTVTVQITIGEDSTTASASGVQGGAAQVGALHMLHARLRKQPAVGRHFYAALERSGAAGTTAWGPNANAMNAGNSAGISGLFLM